ncbi:hypothetical protein CNR22_17380 [Sphingobacteriaceae bacterium]|nr:hypothetical protein CNR22_17380 [Sphingobacteriaceae bacterium]
MSNKLLLILLSFGCFCLSHAQSDSNPRVVSPHVSPALKLTENLGQWQSEVLFKAQLDGGALYVEKAGLTFNFYDKKKYRAIHHGGALKNKFSNLDINCHAYKIKFEKCNTAAAIDKFQAGPDYENFFLGGDKTKWKSGVKNYHQIFLRNLYPDIDYELITAVNGLKYNFHVKAKADPSLIKMRYQGIDKPRLKDGTLVLSLSVNEVIEQRPYAYQLINGVVREVKCDYRLRDNVVSFEFPEGYDKNHELIIDPILVFAAQSGSNADNFGMTATYDNQGNLYSGGTIFDVGYPTTTGAYSSSFNGPAYYGNTDVVITKYSSSGSSLLFSTYFGGGFTETIHSMIVDGSGDLCIYGVTSSSNFPMLSNSYDPTFNGGSFIMFVANGQRFVNGTDIYVSKFNSSGTSLLASTYIGGSANDGLNHSNSASGFYQVPATPPATGVITVAEPDYVNLQYNYGDQCRGEIQVDLLGNIYITSSTRSSDFPTTNGFDSNLGGTQDGILAKFNSGLSSLLNSSFIGGSGLDAGYGLIVKDNFEVYVTGGTTSNNFPHASGGYQSAYQGGAADGYVIRVNPAGNSVMNGTYFGTFQYDQSFFIQSDKYDNVYIYGQSLGNIPVVVASNAASVFSVSGTHQFISRFNASLNVLNLSTVFGNYSNTTDISPSAFAVDKCNNIYISGWGGNVIGNPSPLSNMPLMIPTQSSTDGFDFYFMGLDSNAVNLQYGSYFGGSFSDEHVDGGTSRFDPGGRIYQSVCAGCGGNDDFPVTPGAWPNTPGNPNHSNNCNNGVIKLDFQLQLTIATISTNTLSGCSPLTVTLTNATPAGANSTYTWDLGNGNTTSSNINPVVTYTNPGTYTVQLTIEDNTTCNKIDRTKTYITILPKPSTTITLTGGACTTTIQATQVTTGNLAANPYLWNFGNGNTSTLSAPGYTYPSNGTYTVNLTVTDASGCVEIQTKTITIFDFSPGALSTASLCYGLSTNIMASGGTSYTWIPATNLNNPFIASPLANPLANTIYTVTILNNTSGSNCQKTLTTQVLVLPTPTAGFTYSANPCGGDVRFYDQSEDDIVKWNWILAPAKTSTLQNAYNFYQNGGTFTVSLEATNSSGCKDLADTVITLLKPPPVSVSSTSAVCRGEQAQLHATGGISYLWTPSQTLDFPSSSDPVATPTITTDYSVTITTSDIVNNQNCKFLLIAAVRVDVLSATQIGAFANPTLIDVGDNSTLTYVGDPGAFVTWLPPGSTKPATGYTVTASPVIPTTYTASARRGECEEDVTVHVDAYTEGCIESDAFIPNTFTPNGDGENDLFRVKGLKLYEVNLAIYNRWGEKVFETNDLEKGWDGKYKGKAVDVGVFGWYLKVKCLNGAETFKKGNVTLIR